MSTAQEKLDKKAVRKWFDRVRGRQTRCAKALGVSGATLSDWLSGGTVSARLDRDVPEYVRTHDTTGR